MNSLHKYSGLSKSTFYDNSKNNVKRKNKYDELADLIETFLKENYQKYGSPRITIELHNRGIKINEKKVAKIMKMYHLSAKPKAKR